MMGFLARIAGPRVLLGVLIASGLAVGFLWWQLASAWDDAGRAEQRAADLREALGNTDDELRRVLAQQQRLQRRLRQREDELHGIRTEAERVRRDLADLEARHEEVRDWARRRLPEPVYRRLRDDAGADGADPGGEGDSAGSADGDPADPDPAGLDER